MITAGQTVAGDPRRGTAVPGAAAAARPQRFQVNRTAAAAAIAAGYRRAGGYPTAAGEGAVRPRRPRPRCRSTAGCPSPASKVVDHRDLVRSPAAGIWPPSPAYPTRPEPRCGRWNGLAPSTALSCRPTRWAIPIPCSPFASTGSTCPPTTAIPRASSSAPTGRAQHQIGGDRPSRTDPSTTPSTSVEPQRCLPLSLMHPHFAHSLRLSPLAPTCFARVTTP